MSTSLETKVKTALAKVRKLLDANKTCPVVAGEQSHAYDDKFLLAQNVTNLAVASTIATLESFGGAASQNTLTDLVAKAAGGQRVTIRMTRKETTTFLRETTRELPSSTTVETNSTLFGKTEKRIVQTVKEYHWSYSQTHDLVLFAGASADGANAVTLSQRSATLEVTTREATPPRPEMSTKQDECDMTWLLSQLAVGAGAAHGPTIDVVIDRNDPKCLTPRRNPTIDAACAFVDEWLPFCRELASIYAAAAAVEDLGSRSHGRASVTREGIFIPVLPILQPPEPGEGCDPDASADGAPEPAANATTSSTALLLHAGAQNASGGAPTSRVAVSASFLNQLLAQERAAVAARLAECDEKHPDSSKLASAVEARLSALARHATDVARAYKESVDYIEGLLRKQLVAAVGRELTPADFSQYMLHHAKKVFRPERAPQPFCFAVRMPERSPEGVVAIEAPRPAGAPAGDAAPPQPVQTIVRHTAAHCPPMSFALDAATRVLFHGERYLHAYIDHQFARAPSPPLTLSVRARQFSCFMVLLGRLGPGGTFEPSHAMLARNKDELRIPLDLEQMPSAKEFEDAISSLSPEQRRFAKAYRAMQLEGSVFGVLILQLKPQLEKLLRLPPDALTKEIKLTQQLLELFIEYQIPSDLLAYDGDAAEPLPQKLDAVRAHVKAIYDTIDDAKKAELEEIAKEHAYAHPEAMMMDSDERNMAFGCSGFGGGGKGEGAPPPAGGAPPAARGRAAPRRAAPPQMASAAAPVMMMKSSARVASCRQEESLRGALEENYDSDDLCADLEDMEEAECESVTIPQAPTKPSQDGTPSTNGDAAGSEASGGVEVAPRVDYTRIPSKLDAKLRQLDTDGEMRPTKIKVGRQWSKRSQKALLGAPKQELLYEAEQRREKQRCFDLLDALSLSGSMPIDCASLHVVIAATHCFDASLINTIIQGNINPIEKLERSALIVGETIQALPAPQLVKDSAYDAMAKYAAPMLLPPREQAEGAPAAAI